MNFENRYLDVTAISPETVYRFSNNRYTSENLTFRRFNIQGTSVIRLLAEETPPSPLIAATDPKQQLNTILMSWRQRLKRVLAIDTETCPDCRGTLQIITCIEGPPLIAKILGHVRSHEAVAAIKTPNLNGDTCLIQTIRA